MTHTPADPPSSGPAAYNVRDGVIIRTLASAIFGVRADGSSMRQQCEVVELNAVSAAALRELAASLTQPQLVAKLVGQFDASSETIAVAVDAMLARWLATGWIEAR